MVIPKCMVWDCPKFFDVALLVELWFDLNRDLTSWLPRNIFFLRYFYFVRSLSKNGQRRAPENYHIWDLANWRPLFCLWLKARVYLCCPSLQRSVVVRTFQSSQFHHYNKQFYLTLTHQRGRMNVWSCGTALKIRFLRVPPLQVEKPADMSGDCLVFFLGIVAVRRTGWVLCVGFLWTGKHFLVRQPRPRILAAVSGVLCTIFSWDRNGG
jgi:hypothetical protein